MRRRGVVLIIGLVAAGCGADRTAGSPKNVFGADDRVALRPTFAPYTAIGRLDGGCTGVLVGPDVALTAAHCVVDEQRRVKRERPGSFRPAFADGASRDAAVVTDVHVERYLPGLVRADDWAILTLDRRLGDTYGWMDVAGDAQTRVYQGATIDLAGYSGDFHGGNTAGLHRGCRIRRDDGALLHHDCDMTRGASGGPLFVIEGGRGVVVGINVSEHRTGETSLHLAEWSEAWGNQAVPARRFAAQVRARRGGAPAPTPTPTPTPTPAPARHVDGYASLHPILMNGSYDVRAAYQRCYDEIATTVVITETSFRTPSLITVRGRPEWIEALNAMRCVRRAYLATERSTRASAREIKGAAALVGLVKGGIELVGLDEQLRYAAAPQSESEAAFLDKKQGLLPSAVPLSAATLAAARAKGIEPVARTVAYDGVAVVVHARNRTHKLTLAQLRRIYNCELFRWEQLPSSGLAGPIRAVKPEAAIAKAETLQALTGLASFGSCVRSVADASEVSRLAAADPLVLGFGGLGALTAGTRGVVMARDDSTRSYAPSVDTVRAKTYPLARELLVYEATGTHETTPDEAVLLETLLAPEVMRALLVAHDLVPVR